MHGVVRIPTWTLLFAITVKWHTTPKDALYRAAHQHPHPDDYKFTSYGNMGAQWKWINGPGGTVTFKNNADDW